MERNFRDFYKEAKELCVRCNDLNGEYYLEPLYRFVLEDNNLRIGDVTDRSFTIEELKEMLELEVRRRNAVESRTREVCSWLWDIINSKIDPLVIDEQNDYIKNLSEYFKNKKDALIAEQEKSIAAEDIKKNVNSNSPFNINFAKRK